VNLVSILVVALMALGGGLVLWRRSKRGEAPRQMKTVGVALVAVGTLGVVAIVADLVMFALFP